APVQAARNQFVFVSRFDLEGRLTPLGLNDPGRAGHSSSRRGRRKMTQLNLDSDRTLVGFEKRLNSFPRGAFQQTDQSGSAQHSGHPLGRKIDQVQGFYHKPQLVRRADFDRGFHGLNSFKAPAPSETGSSSRE